MTHFPRYIVGIDLGTTNCAVAFIDTTLQDALPIRSFTIPQLVDPFKISQHLTLPSVLYLADTNEFPENALSLPWRKSSLEIVGNFALKCGGKRPSQLIESAKSWLCHARAVREGKILPNEASSERKLTPGDVTAKFLEHIRESWNFLMSKEDPDLELEQQSIIITTPASFDEMARSLTLQAARSAGLKNVTLLEEPLAAFYSWLGTEESQVESFFKEGDVILIVDVGGGTTDFSLIEVITSEKKNLEFQRMAVGDHLLLGGDNMDVSLQLWLQNKHRAHELSRSQEIQLKQLSRELKEEMLGPSPPLTKRITLQGTGSSLIKGSLHLEASREEVLKILKDGFFGEYSFEEGCLLNKTPALKTLDLPYASDPSITKQLANFLKKHHPQDKPLDYILFNGGSMKPQLFQDQIIKNLTRWFKGEAPKVLPSKSLDLAVSLGAAYFGKAKRGLGVRVGGGSPRGYYLEIETKEDLTEALTVLPRGTEEEVVLELYHDLWVKPNTPVSFKLYYSHVRLNDQIGDLVSVDKEELQTLAPIYTQINFGKNLTKISKEEIPVHLILKVSTIGVIEMHLKSKTTEHQWRLEFQLKTLQGNELLAEAPRNEKLDRVFDQEILEKSSQIIHETFSGKLSPPKMVFEKLEEVAKLPKLEFSCHFLRSLWKPLMEESEFRSLSEEHRERFWNLAGFFLRPGFGAPLDDHRIRDLWKLILGEMKMPLSLPVKIQHWIMFRRIAGGLNKGQQIQLANDLIKEVIDLKAEKLLIRTNKDAYAFSERLRALASLELVDTKVKIGLGKALLKRILNGEGSQADFFALTRLGGRELLYASASHTIPLEIVSEWVKELLTKQEFNEDEIFLLRALVRKTAVASVNLKEALIQEVVERLPKAEREGLKLERPLSEEDEGRLFGDRMPPGLSLRGHCG